MVEMPTWEVDLFVDGPVTLRRRFNTTEQKGFRLDDPFWSHIGIVSTPSGLRATVTARASNAQLAREVAVFFFGRMLDVLGFKIDLPLFSHLTEHERPHDTRIRQRIRRNIEPQEIKSAFKEAQRLRDSEPSFLRSLGWYRKGLYTEDPFDKFLAFWNAIEILASNYDRLYRLFPSIDKDRAKNGSKSQIWECFKALWGSCEQWPNIAGENKWIDDSYETRKDIAHGVSSVDIKKVALVADKLDITQRVAYAFLETGGTSSSSTQIGDNRAKGFWILMKKPSPFEHGMACAQD